MGREQASRIPNSLLGRLYYPHAGHAPEPAAARRAEMEG